VENVNLVPTERKKKQIIAYIQWWQYAFYTVFNLKKVMKSNPKHPSCKKKCVAPKMPLWKMMWNPRWRPRNACDARVMIKLLITIIQVNLVSNPSEMWKRQHRFTWIVIIKNFAINVPSQLFFGRHLEFHIFFSKCFFWAAHFFYNWAVLIS